MCNCNRSVYRLYIMQGIVARQSGSNYMNVVGRSFHTGCFLMELVSSMCFILLIFIWNLINGFEVVNYSYAVLTYCVLIYIINFYFLNLCSCKNTNSASKRNSVVCDNIKLFLYFGQDQEFTSPYSQQGNKWLD